MSLLSVIQGVALRCNYPQPSAAFSSPDTNIQLMISCVQDTGDEMIERVDWQSLKQRSPAQFTGDGTTAAWTLPNDFGRLSPSDTFVSSAYPTISMPGPVNEDDLIRMKALPMSLYPSAWREVGGMIEFYPVLQNAEVVSYVYASDLWILNGSGSKYLNGQIGSDADTFLLSERALRLGAIWRFKAAKGLEYSQFFADYEASLSHISSQESTGRVVNMSREFAVPDDLYSGQITDNTDQMY